MLITPTATPYDRLSGADLVEVDLAGDRLAGSGRPSTEWPFHAAVYSAFPQVGGVVHAHPPYATAVSCARREIPAFHYMVAIAGGANIRCAAYSKPGSEALAGHVVEALEGRQACLLANHGMVAVGGDLEAAFDLAVEIENLAKHYWLTLQVGDPVLLSETEMSEVLEHFETYGQPDSAE